MIFTGNFGNHSRKKWFSVAVLLAIFCGILPKGTWAENDTIHKKWSEVPALSNFSVLFDTHDATCFNNGEIGFVFVDKNNNNAPVTPGQMITLKLSDFSIGYQGTVFDTSQRWKRNIPYDYVMTWVPMESGTYKITLEFNYHVNTNQFWVVDTVVTLNVNLLYQEPSMAALTVTSNDGIKLGNIPTLNCTNTGRVQVRVDGGKMPYRFWVVNHNNITDTLRYVEFREDEYLTFDYGGNSSDTVHTPWNYGDNTTDSTKADYFRYFTFDDMPRGSWDFHFIDECGYHLPPVSQKVDTILPPRLKDVEIWASSGNPEDDNVVKVNAVIGSYEYPYYINQYAPYMQYRFLHGGANESLVPWNDLFPNHVLPNNYNGTKPLKVTLTDVFNAEFPDYCHNVWNKRDTLQVRMLEGYSPCGELTSWDTFTVYNTNPKYYEAGKVTITDSTVLNPNDPCLQTIYQHDDFFYYKYKGYYPNNTYTDKEHEGYRYHFTYPIVWEWKDKQTSTLIKRDTVYALVDTDNIARRTTVSKQEIQDAVPSSFTGTGAQATTRTLTLELKDANNCVLYTNDRVAVNINPTNKPVQGPQWEVTDFRQPACCTEKRSITISEKYSLPDENYDGLTITLTDCPDMTTYGFTAVYHAADHLWTYTKNDFINGPDLDGFPEGNGLKFSGYCLPPGEYTFEITQGQDGYAPCQNGPVSVSKTLGSISFPDLGEVDIPQVVTNCTEEYFTYEQGLIAKKTVTAVGDTTQVFVPTCFKMVAGPVGGYSGSDNTTHYVRGSIVNGQPHLGDSIRISVHTTPDHPYVFMLYPESESGLCGSFEHYDTIWYTGQKLSFNFAMALLCNEGATLGPVYVQAKGGAPRYTYQLYSGPNATGSPIGAPQTLSKDEVARFEDVPLDLNQQLSCYVQDSCGNAYPVSFYPQSLAEMQKTWFNDDGSKTLTTCEGTYVQLHSLNAGNIFEYVWLKVNKNAPDDTIATTSDPNFFLPRSESDTVMYRVEILVTDCSNDPLHDTVTVYPLHAPLLELSGNAVVCPGEEAEVRFTPTSQYMDHGVLSNVSFKVVYETALGKDTVAYNNIHSGQTILDNVYPMLETIIYPVEINDGQCDFRVPEDTIRIAMSDNIVDPCKIITKNSEVCFGKDATLKALCTATPVSATNPNVLRWYSDFSLTELVSGPYNQTAPNDTSFLQLPGLVERTIRYVSVEKLDYCSPTNLTANNVVKLSSTDGHSNLNCKDAILFYDDGGEEGNYSVSQGGDGYYKHVFVSASNRPVVLHFDTLALADGSTMMVFSGDELNEDSLLYRVTGTYLHENTEDYTPINPPDVIISNGNTMTVYFKPGTRSSLGWRAYVKPAPGIAIADVVVPDVVHYDDEVCQSQTSGYNNSDIFDLNIPGADQANLSEKVKVAKMYEYSKTITSSKGCDSTVVFNLTVTPAPRWDTTAVVANTGIYWYGPNGQDSVYYEEPGTYVVDFVDDRGCDNIRVLNLIVLKVETPDVNICVGDSDLVRVWVETFDSAKPRSPLLEEYHSVGDVYCRRVSGGSLLDEFVIVRPDTFLHHATELYPMGVVLYMEPDNIHGLAMSIVDANGADTCFQWSKDINLGGSVVNNSWQALFDMSGYDNTNNIRAACGATTDNASTNWNNLKTKAPAAYYCYYYDPYFLFYNRDRVGALHYGWHLPSSGEIRLYYSYRFTVNTTLQKLQNYGATLPRSGAEVHYWTSSGGSAATKAACVNGKGQYTLHHDKTRSCENYQTNKVTRAVRPMIRF